MVMYSWCLLVVEYMARKSSGPIWEEEKEEEEEEKTWRTDLVNEMELISDEEKPFHPVLVAVIAVYVIVVIVVISLSSSSSLSPRRQSRD